MENSGPALLILGLALFWSCQPVPPTRPRIAVATDLHVLSPQIHDQGEAFLRYAQTGAGLDLSHGTLLLDTWVDQLLALRPEAAILTGDLTANGDRRSHELVARTLAKLEVAGISVWVIPGNHDLNNPQAVGFRGDQTQAIDSVDATTFAEIYGGLGWDEAISRDQESLSYVAEVAPGLWVLLLDTSGGFISDSTRTWIVAMGERAREQKKTLLAASHYSLADHNDVITVGFTVDDAEEITEILLAAGVRLALSGHIHAQDISSRRTPSGTLVDIATGSLAIYPQAWGELQWDPQTEGWKYQREMLELSAEGYKAWSREAFLEESRSIFSDDPAAGDLFARLNQRFFAGQEADTPVSIDSTVLRRLTESPGFLGDYVTSILKDQDDLDDRHWESR